MSDDKLVHTVALIIDANYHTAISKALSTAEQVVAALQSERASMEGEIEAAYREGWRDSENSSNGFVCVQETESWERSKARAALTSSKTGDE